MLAVSGSSAHSDRHIGLRFPLSPLCYFIGYNREALQPRGPERCRDRHVGGVAAGSHQYTAEAALVVPRIKRPPSVAEPNLEPGAEVHWRSCRDTDITQVAGRVTRWNMQ